jgi:uncharacterized protein (DUF362 family)
MTSKIALIKSENYQNIKDKIKSTLNLLGGIENFIHPGQKVLLKPNLFGYDCPKHAATNLEFLSAIIDIVKEHTLNIYIGELIASDQPGLNKKAFKKHGLIELAKEKQVKLIDFQTSSLKKTTIKDPLVCAWADIVEPMKTFDFIINIPKFKGHPHTYITGAVKNCFGCIRDSERGEIHKEFQGENFGKAVVDIYSGMKFDLTIMDAIIGMDGDESPAYGSEAKIGYILAGTDPVAIDAIISKITGHELNLLPTIKYGHIKGIGTANFKEIKILGDKPEKRPFKHHKNYINLVNKSKTQNKDIKNKKSNSDTSNLEFPTIDKSKCTFCQMCAINCPAKAIIVDNENRTVSIDESKCIKCYRCLESCQGKAIFLKK